MTQNGHRHGNSMATSTHPVGQPAKSRAANWWRRRESKRRRPDARNLLRDTNFPCIRCTDQRSLIPAVSCLVPLRTAPTRRFMATMWQRGEIGERVERSLLRRRAPRHWPRSTGARSARRGRGASAHGRGIDPVAAREYAVVILQARLSTPRGVAATTRVRAAASRSNIRKSTSTGKRSAISRSWIGSLATGALAVFAVSAARASDDGDDTPFIETIYNFRSERVSRLAPTAFCDAMGAPALVEDLFDAYSYETRAKDGRVVNAATRKVGTIRVCLGLKTVSPLVFNFYAQFQSRDSR